MGHQRRIKLYNELEEIRKRPLVSYVTSIRPNMSGQMAGDAIDPIIEQIRIIPDSCKELDFLIISNGGDPITALRIISILRERFEKITVMVPYIAYSAATILALGANDILMHPYSNLGPVDPQLNIQKNNGTGLTGNIAFSSEDLRNYIEFVKNDVGISDQAYLVEALKALASEVGVLPIGSAKRSQQLTLSLSSKMLETHISDKTQAASISKTLNSSYYHHGYAVGRSEAKEIGLNVVNPESRVEKLMWEIWEDFREEMRCNKAFDLVSEMMNDPQVSNQLRNVSIIDLPANLPPELTQKIFSNFAQNAQATIRPTIELSQLLAAVESKNICYQFINRLNTIYWRNPDMTLGCNATAYNKGWEEQVIEEDQYNVLIAAGEAAATVQ